MATASYAEAGYFRAAFEFFHKYRWMFLSANTRYLIDRVFDEFPVEWIQFLSSLSNEEINRLPFGVKHENIPVSLHEFFNSLKRLQPIHPTSMSTYPIKQFKGISPKKLHEIYKLSQEINDILASVKTRTNKGDIILVDLGSGLGYLSQLLTEQFGYRVLGLEADPERVAAAQKRQEQHFSHTKGLVVYEQHFVDANTDTNKGSSEFIRSKLLECFGATFEATRIALIGLHACADLTVTACQLFCTMESVCALAIMPCCYHKMKRDESERSFENIPLSECMRDADRSGLWLAIINRPFLRLACQQTAARWERMSAAEHTTHGSNMFDRAKLELLLLQGETVKKRKKPSAPEPMAIKPDISHNLSNLLDDYQLFDLQTNKPWTIEHHRQLREISEKYPDGAFLSEMLTGLQAAIQSICEYVVLLDKVYYICENMTTGNVELKKIFQEELSPRCFLLAATK